MTERTAHGTGASALVRVETLPVDELPPLNADDTATGAAIAASRGRPFTRGNRAAAGRKPALATSAGIPIEAADPLYKKALRWARRYRRWRVQELTIQHGGQLSAGVCAMITSSALDMAASRFLTAKAAETGETAWLAQASRHAMSSKQIEHTAIELAAREAAARPQARNALLPGFEWPADDKGDDQ